MELDEESGGAAEPVLPPTGNKPATAADIGLILAKLNSRLIGEQQPCSKNREELGGAESITGMYVPTLDCTGTYSRRKSLQTEKRIGKLDKETKQMDATGDREEDWQEIRLLQTSFLRMRSAFRPMRKPHMAHLKVGCLTANGVS